MLKPLLNFAEFAQKNFNFSFIYTVDTDNKIEKLQQYTPYSYKFVDNGKKVDGKENVPLLDVEVEKDICNTIFEGPLGFSICTIINSLNTILCELDSLETLLKNSSIKKEDNLDDLLIYNYISQFKEKMEIIIPNYSKLFYTTIDNFVNYLDVKVPKYAQELQQQVDLISQFDWEADSNGNKQYNIEEMKKQLQSFRTVEFYKNESVEFISKFKESLNISKKIIDKAFITNHDSNTKFYSGFTLRTPNCEIRYNTKTHPMPIQYTYKFYEIYDFINIALYQLSINKKVISKCGNCDDYFIPQIRNDEIYCDKVLNNNKTCKDIGKAKSFSEKQAQERPYDKLYKTICDRLKNNKEYKEKYLDDFINQYNNLFNSQNTKKQLDITIHKFLTEYDKDFQKKHPIKKGRPYTSQNYWYKE